MSKTNEEAIEACNELRNLVETWKDKLSFEQAIGILELVKHELISDLFEGVRDE